MAASALSLALEITGRLQVVETTNEARLEVASQSGTERVALSALLDQNTCPLCRALDGKVFKSDSPEAARFQPPFHINCRCIWTAVGDDEEGALDWWEPGQVYVDAKGRQYSWDDLVELHGHFLTNPNKYAQLKVPSSPGRRDFVFHYSPGQVGGTVEWIRPRGDWYELNLEPQTSEVGKRGLAVPRFATTQLKTLATATTTDELAAWAQHRWPNLAGGLDLTNGDPVKLRAMFDQLDQLGRKYRSVESLLKQVKVVPAELWEQGEYAAMTDDGVLKLNEMFFGGGQALAARWGAEQRARVKPEGLLPIPAITTHEFGHLYAQWLRDKRPELRHDLLDAMALHPAPATFQPGRTVPAEAFANAFAVLHLQPTAVRDPFVKAVRDSLRYELRVPWLEGRDLTRYNQLGEEL